MIIATENIKRSRYYVLCLVFFAIFSFPILSAQTFPDDEVLFSIGNREIQAGQFNRYWERALDGNSRQINIDEFIARFIIFQLKIEHAIEEEIHLEPAIIEELATYRNTLSLQFTRNTEKLEEFINEAYDRMHKDVNASHILVKLSPDYSPADTLEAWEKAISIRDRLIEGESFESVASATSDDPSAKTNSGNLGYFTVFHMPYSFENYVYSADKDSLSMPVRTRFGYHIIRLNDIRESAGELKTSHIMIGFDKYPEDTARERIFNIYEKLNEGDDFASLAREYSTDHSSSGLGGDISWFSSGAITPEFESAAFALDKPGDISAPVRSSYGWHIIKLTDRRDILPPLEEIKTDLISRLHNSGDLRSKLIRKANLDVLKSEWGFKENINALEIFKNITSERIFDGSWQIPEHLDLNDVLFSIPGHEVTQLSFAEFIMTNAQRARPWPIEEYIDMLYQEFLSSWLTGHESDNLEQQNPEFRYRLQEYHNSILLYEITERMVWSKLDSDSDQFIRFFQANRDKYMWGQRIAGVIFTTDDLRVARRVAWRAKRSRLFSSRDADWIIRPINNNNTDTVVHVERGVFPYGEREIINNIEWTKGVSDIFELNNEYYVVLINEITESTPKTLEEVKEEVVTDYEEHLSDIWIRDIKNRYEVTLNRNLLNDIEY